MIPTIRYSAAYQCLVLENEQFIFYFNPEVPSDYISLVRILKRWSERTAPHVETLSRSEELALQEELAQRYLDKGGHITRPRGKNILNLADLGDLEP